VGKHLINYDSMVALTHFKGHAMGGFGGSLKNIAIGCVDGPIGKKMVHDAPDNDNYETWLQGEPFQENMVESAKAVVDHFDQKIVFINVLRNMSVDCDCAGIKAAPVKARDLGILASTDLPAVEQASIDIMNLAFGFQDFHHLVFGFSSAIFPSSAARPCSHIPYRLY